MEAHTAIVKQEKKKKNSWIQQSPEQQQTPNCDETRPDSSGNLLSPVLYCQYRIVPLCDGREEDTHSGMVSCPPLTERVRWQTGEEERLARYENTSRRMLSKTGQTLSEEEILKGLSIHKSFIFDRVGDISSQNSLWKDTNLPSLVWTKQRGTDYDSVKLFFSCSTFQCFLSIVGEESICLRAFRLDRTIDGPWSGLSVKQHVLPRGWFWKSSSTFSPGPIHHPLIITACYISRNTFTSASVDNHLSSFAVGKGNLPGEFDGPA